MSAPLHQLSLTEAAQGIARGAWTSVELVSACLARIQAREERVRAWAFLDPEQALAQARACDALPAAASMPLRGAPVGVKDIIDTADMPTRCGAAIYESRRPAQDAECVRLLRRSGAVLMGKTVTTEFAFYAPGKTANPHNPRHTPGGSSSGSAAAVADCHVPAALGTQTSGSIIRPASFNGVIGYKPTYAAWPLAGVHPLAPQLDTLGAFSRSLADLRLLRAALGGREALPESSPSPPRRPAAIALARTPAWEQAQASTRQAASQLVAAVAAQGVAIVEPDETPLQGLRETHYDQLAWGAAESLGPLVDAHPGQLRPQTRQLVEAGRALEHSFPERLRAAQTAGRRFLAQVFDRADLILTPSAPGEAPLGLDSTGDPVFNGIWTFLQTPCLNLPLTTGPGGLPIGVQLVCAPGWDVELFAYGTWLQNLIARGDWQA